MGVLGIGIFVGLPKEEKAECLKWKTQSTEFPNWYATKNEVEQCQKYNIDLSQYEKSK